MQNLAKKEYWDSVYKNIDIKKTGKFFKLKEWLKHTTRDYSNFVMWEILMPKFLPKNPDLKVIEIGCAPGKYLIGFHNKFGYQPFGVEYSEKGVRIAQENFVSNGLSPENIIKADFFDPVFVAKYEGVFDLIFSRGFIEHYDDVGAVVDRHLSLIKKGGYVVISIPNLSGVNKFLAKFLNIDSYNLHNTSIMNLKSFEALFPQDKVEKIYCDYVGAFSFGLFNTNKKWKEYLRKFGGLLQRLGDLFLRVFVKDNSIKGRFGSPYLLFVGRKR